MIHPSTTIPVQLVLNIIIMDLYTVMMGLNMFIPPYTPQVVADAVADIADTMARMVIRAICMVMWAPVCMAREACMDIPAPGVCSVVLAEDIHQCPLICSADSAVLAQALVDSTAALCLH